MTKLYVIFGAIVCVFMGYASATGYSVYDSIVTGQWKAKGKTHQGGRGFGRSRGFYHK